MVRVTHPPGGRQRLDADSAITPKAVRVLKPPGGESSISFGYDDDTPEYQKKTTSSAAAGAAASSTTVAPEATPAPEAAPSEAPASEAGSSTPSEAPSSPSKEASSTSPSNEASAAPQEEISSAAPAATNGTEVNGSNGDCSPKCDSVVVDSKYSERSNSFRNEEASVVSAADVEVSASAVVNDTSSNYVDTSGEYDKPAPVRSVSVNSNSNPQDYSNSSATKNEASDVGKVNRQQSVEVANDASTNGSNASENIARKISNGSGSDAPCSMGTRTKTSASGERTVSPGSDTVSKHENGDQKSPSPDTKGRLFGETAAPRAAERPHVGRVTPSNHHMRSSIFTGNDEEPSYRVSQKTIPSQSGNGRSAASPAKPAQQPPVRVRQPPGGFSTKLW